MTSTTAKARLLEVLIEPLKGCKGLYTHRQQLMLRVMRMPDLEVRDCSAMLMWMLIKLNPEAKLDAGLLDR